MARINRSPIWTFFDLISKNAVTAHMVTIQKVLWYLFGWVTVDWDWKLGFLRLGFKKYWDWDWDWVFFGIVATLVGTLNICGLFRLVVPLTVIVTLVSCDATTSAGSVVCVFDGRCNRTFFCLLALLWDLHLFHRHFCVSRFRLNRWL